MAQVRPGVTTAELDAVAADVIAAAGATPSFLGYGADDDRPGFPGVVCLSVDDEVVHGVPGERVLAEGDLLSIDCGAIVEGWHGDAAVSVVVGDRAAARRRRRAARTHPVGAVARASPRSASAAGSATSPPPSRTSCAGSPYGVVEDYVGHGIGVGHAHGAGRPAPTRPRGPLAGLRGRGPRLVPGMVLAVEPMLTLGEPDTHELDDGWTAVTDDGSLGLPLGAHRGASRRPACGC